MGGEKGLLPGTGCKGLGSPPHGRGKADVLFTHFLAWRITPAWAGKRATSVRARATTRDHPRVGGEKSRLRSRKTRKWGSPPRRRGKGSRCRTLQHRHRITPAWAGKRLPHPQRHQAAQDHPRMGGEKARPCIAPPPRRGSPPRGRGKGIDPKSAHPRNGITPAWAGKSGVAEDEHPQAEDHPRVGGEKGVM